MVQSAANLWKGKKTADLSAVGQTHNCWQSENAECRAKEAPRNSIYMLISVRKRYKCSWAADDATTACRFNIDFLSCVVKFCGFAFVYSLYCFIAHSVTLTCFCHSEYGHSDTSDGGVRDAARLVLQHWGRTELRGAAASGPELHPLHRGLPASSRSVSKSRPESSCRCSC